MIDMTQPMRMLDLSPIPRNSTLDKGTVAVILGNVANVQLPAEKAEEVLKAIHDVTGEPLTLGAACMNALLAPVQGEQLSGEEQVRRFELARRCNVKKRPVKIKKTDADYIEKVAQKVYAGCLVGVQIGLLLRGKDFAALLDEDSVQDEE